MGKKEKITNKVKKLTNKYEKKGFGWKELLLGTGIGVLVTFVVKPRLEAYVESLQPRPVVVAQPVQNKKEGLIQVT